MKTVLCVDDSTTVLLSLSAILSKAGYGVEKAASAEEALGKLKGTLKPDLVITDLNMPGMNGIDFIKQVRLLPNLRFVPILFLTTESQQAKRAEAKAAGASGWLVKPVNGEELINTIKLVVR
ncbi:MAG TPA: response regulator [Parasulfuritortus sp.]